MDEMHWRETSHGAGRGTEEPGERASQSKAEAGHANLAERLPRRQCGRMTGTVAHGTVLPGFESCPAASSI